VVLYPSCLLPLRLPRFCLGWRRSRSSQLLISEPLAEDRTCCITESVGVISLTGIKPENLFVKVSEQVVRLHTNIGAFNGTFYQTPEVLNTISVNLALNVSSAWSITSWMKSAPRSS
jgi:hypothetical protein